MKVIPPITLNYTNTVVDGSSDYLDPAEWDTDLSYSVGDKVKVTTSNINKIYECIVNATNTDASPEVDITKITPKWVEIGSINKYAMFDNIRSTQTVAYKSMVVTITPGQLVDSIAVMNTTGVLQLNITAKNSGGTTVYSKDTILNKRAANNSWYDYFFARFWTKSSVAFFDLPITYGNLTIVITFTGDTGMGVGNVVLGNGLYIGNTQRGATADILNFSSIERDNYGTASLVPRRNVPKTRQILYLKKSLLDTVIEYRSQLDSIPAVWSAYDNEISHPYFDAGLIYGFYREFTFNIDNPIGVYINLELEEL